MNREDENPWTSNRYCGAVAAAALRLVTMEIRGKRYRFTDLDLCRALEIRKTAFYRYLKGAGITPLALDGLLLRLAVVRDEFGRSTRLMVLLGAQIDEER